MHIWSYVTIMRQVKNRDSMSNQDEKEKEIKDEICERRIKYGGRGP